MPVLYRIVCKLFFLFLSFTVTHSLSAQIITTVVGTGVTGNSGDNGPAASAQLTLPSGIAFDNQGNLLIADIEGYKIRKVNLQTGIITTIAGLGYMGSTGDGGPAINAGLSGPTGVAVDKSGNIYIAEQYGSIIRKINGATGIVSTIAGNYSNGSYAGDGGPSVNALVDRPTDVDVDAAGNVYIADWDNNVIRKITVATGIITTVAGKYPGSTGYAGDGGPAVNALLYQCPRVLIDPAGNILIGDQLNHVIRKVNVLTGIINTIVGNHAAGYAGDGGPAINATLNGPSGMVLDAQGNLYFADSYNNVIRKVDATTGIITTIAGNGIAGYSGDGGSPLNASLNRPTDLLIDADGHIYITDVRNHVVRKITVCPKVKLGNDTSICRSATLLLDAGNKLTQFQWSNGASSQSIQVTAPGTYSVVASDGGSCVSKDTIQVSNHPDLAFNWPHTDALCSSDEIVLQAPPGTTVLQWQDGSAATSYTVTQPGKYWLAVTDRNHCTQSDTLTINEIITAPADFLKEEVAFCGYEPFVLSPEMSFVKYRWSTGDTAAVTTVPNVGSYWLQVTDLDGCTWREDIAVKEKECKQFISIPNAFTPNNDFKNDVFKPSVEGPLRNYKMTVYNRWGQRIFESTDWRKGWDGKLNGIEQGAGMYVWTVSYEWPGTGVKVQRGTVLLIR